MVVDSLAFVLDRSVVLIVFVDLLLLFRVVHLDCREFSVLLVNVAWHRLNFQSQSVELVLERSHVWVRRLNSSRNRLFLCWDCEHASLESCRFPLLLVDARLRVANRLLSDQRFFHVCLVCLLEVVESLVY